MILFIDTHDELITIALKNKDDLFVKTQESEYSHSIYTMPMIENIFKENNLNVKDLEKIAIKKPPAKAKAEYIKSQLGEIKQDILNNNFAYADIEEKYKIKRTAMRTYLSKEQDYETLKEILKENGKRNQITRGILNSNNLIRKYQINNNMTAEEISKITHIPVPTIRKLSSGQTDINKIKFKTKQKLIDAKIL